MREIRTLRAMWRALETGPRQVLHGHEGGNPGYKPRMSLRATAPVLDPTKIMCAVDDTEESIKTIGHAGMLAQGLECSLIIVHVMPPEKGKIGVSNSVTIAIL